MFRRAGRVAVVAAALAVVVSHAAESQQQAFARERAARNHLYDRVQVSGGASLLRYSTDLRLDAAVGDPGSSLSLESDLLLPKSRIAPRGALRWQPGRRHELEVSYQASRRSGDLLTLDEQIEIEGEVFNVGANVRARLESDQVALTYRLALLAGEETTAGLAVGAGAFFGRFALQAFASLGDQTGRFAVDERRTAPLVSLGGFARHRFASHLYGEADLRAFQVTISNVKASVLEGGAVLRWFLTPALGAETGVQYQRFVLNSANDALPGRLAYGVFTVRAGIILAP